MLGLVGLGLGALGSFAQLGTGIWQAKEQLKQAKDAQRLAREQYFTENARYNEREAERKTIMENSKRLSAQAAKAYTTPIQAPALASQEAQKGALSPTQPEDENPLTRY